MKTIYRISMVLIAMFGISQYGFSQSANPDSIPASQTSIVEVSSQSPDPKWHADFAVDGLFTTDNQSNMWTSDWSNDVFPHYITVDLGVSYAVKEVIISRSLHQNGLVKDYELYVSNSPTFSDDPTVSGTFTANTSSRRLEDDTVRVETPVEGRYVKFVGLTSSYDQSFIQIDEIMFYGTVATGIDANEATGNIVAYPSPTTGVVNISLPAGNGFNYKVYSITGQIVSEGCIEGGVNNYAIDLGNSDNGVYIIDLVDNLGKTYNAKVVKE